MNYPESELEDALRRAFVNHRCDFIIIDDRRQRFLIESAALGERKGWLAFELCDTDEQSTQWRYRLTPAGRAHFGSQGGVLGAGGVKLLA